MAAGFLDERCGRNLKHSLNIHHSNLEKSILAQMRYADQSLSRQWRSPHTFSRRLTISMTVVILL
jgi:hypothetical protein